MHFSVLRSTFSWINNNNNWYYVVEKQFNQLNAIKFKLIKYTYRCFHKEITFQFDGSAFSLLDFFFWAFQFVFVYLTREGEKIEWTKGYFTIGNMKLWFSFNALKLSDTAHRTYVNGNTLARRDTRMPFSKTIFG